VAKEPVLSTVEMSIQDSKKSSVMERKTVSLQEAANILGVGIFTVRRLVKSKSLKTVRLSQRGHHLVPLTEIDRILKENQ
jgi:excisionase family DNA binding protein